MKIFIICSKHMYHKVLPVKDALESQGHIITVPNSFDAPMKEEEMKLISKEEHIAWKSARLWEQVKKVKSNDAVLVLNYEKKDVPNYIGGATFLEIAHAFYNNKKIFLLNPIPKNIFTDELTAMNPTVLNGDLSKIY